MSNILVFLDSRAHLHGEREVRRFSDSINDFVHPVRTGHQTRPGALKVQSESRVSVPIEKFTDSVSDCSHSTNDSYLLVDEIDGAAHVEIDEVHRTLFFEELSTTRYNVRVTPAKLPE